MFKKVMIANRGAIAVRIERTLKKMGITSVALYSQADQDSLHVANADEAYFLGDGKVAETYLNTDLILKIAKEHGVDAIHPGYGFLSENADFARVCEQNGIKFIGPTPEQMEMFGLKHSAREIARKANVPMLEGTPLLESADEAVQAAEKLGYPVILKSTAGGGGIGMKVCYSEDELRAAYESCTHLAKANFSNAGVFLEKYLEKARHIEVQIFGNQYGEVAPLAERDCSVQRRNQKVMEECPAYGISEETRKELKAAAKRLAMEVGYRSAGTVEFLYDVKSQGFYFLEVNTRLQVEHGVTEEVLGVDLVEWMVKEAAGELKGLDSLYGETKGVSIQTRIYAEDGKRNFAPSAGKLDKVVFSKDARIETWIKDAVVVSPNYDPMLAKVIVHADDRAGAIAKMKKVLEETKIYGITTNIDYLHSFLQTKPYMEGDLYTHMLDGFTYSENTIEVLDGGLQTTIQDYPARLKYWDIGVPPSGAMDNFSFRLANIILGNPQGVPGFEFTLKGGKYKFRADMTICLTGCDMEPKLDDADIPMFKAVSVKEGQVLSLAKAKTGLRSYMAVKGGLDVPEYLGSASTFALGGFGGHSGRVLRTGDLLHVKMDSGAVPSITVDPSYLSTANEISVVPGPHCTDEFLKPEFMKQLSKTDWEVHFNSDRTGVRLMGPTPAWAREDGGEAGLHPSNLHDNAYAVGTIDMTGDMPIIIGPDGPSLGGFVCPATIPSGELWKQGQLAPGSKVHFNYITVETAEKIRSAQEEYLSSLAAGKNAVLSEVPRGEALSQDYPILKKVEKDGKDKLVIRCAGDQYVLVEYGEMEIEMRLRIRVNALKQAIVAEKRIPLIDATPGIRSLQVHIDSTKMSILELTDLIVALDSQIGDLSKFRVKSRKIKMPLSWHDPQTILAMNRYKDNVRPNAPWCPDNIEFIRRINGMKSIDDVKDLIFNETYIVMGLGDVYLGAPVCIPLDPRHRLVTTKYNPARTWTPENAVGIGGAYMGIYGMEGPGGYQLFGRTVQTWNPKGATKSFKEGKPWLLDFFDQIQFYPVSAEELLQIREDFLRGRYEVEIEETVFDYGEYEKFLESIKEDTAKAKAHQVASFEAEKQMWKEKGLDKFEVHHNAQEESAQVPDGATEVLSNMPGSVWKILKNVGDSVKKGESIIIEESMKMETAQTAPCDGKIVGLYVKPGQEVFSGQILAAIK
ncbi:MAG: urea carboxylase [Treponema sp.]|nr:urea carboxylase [Candidatus Treponema equi]